MSKDTGGTAFPGYDIYGDGKQHLAGHPHGGMSLRDYFAAKALQSIAVGSVEPYGYGSTHRLWAECSYQIADAMLNERAK